MLKVYKKNKNAIIPKYATLKSACFDIHACLDSGAKIKCFTSNHIFYMGTLHESLHIAKCVNNTIFVSPNCRMLVPTGLIFNIPEGHSIRLHPRSGLSFKNGIVLANSEGIIDQDYKEEVFVPIYNISHKSFEIKNGDRICQAELVKDLRVELVETKDEISKSGDRNGGFGSTGV